MDHREIIPLKSISKFYAICLHDTYLCQNKQLQEQILDCMVDMLIAARQEWREIHAAAIDAIVKVDRKAQAQKRGQARDRKYAPFREYFKQIQKEKYALALQKGDKLVANGFVEWFLKNKAKDIKIPYVKQNQKNKLRQLAQENNREFKKSF